MASQGLASDRGSEWRKWDLHVHTPGTRLNDQYMRKNGELDWERFCQVLHDSDVAAFGITDYFSVDSFFTCREEYSARYPNDNKLFFPNLELRLSTAVHDDAKEINLHVLFRPDLTREQAEIFLRNLKLTGTARNGNRHITAWEARNWGEEQLKSASVDLSKVKNAIQESFDGIFADRNIHDVALLIASGRKDGLSPGRRLTQRKRTIINEIDKDLHAVFARAKDAPYWLGAENRQRDSNHTLFPLPTFGGCDAHDFETLLKTLGRTGEDEHRRWEATWIKANLSWDGLLQTLVEPDTRVKIARSKPDEKENYRIIDSVLFTDEKTFPNQITLNPNLNAIIGSRSSGKSSLLAHIAHAVDPVYTEKQQEEAGNDKGPAAGWSWNDIKAGYCKVKWCDDQAENKVVYIPQNFLNKLGENADHVSSYILPAIRKNDLAFSEKYERFNDKLKALEEKIRGLVSQWFNTFERRELLSIQIDRLPTEKAISNEIIRIEKKIRDIQGDTQISEEDSRAYREATKDIDTLKERIKDVIQDRDWLEHWLLKDEETDRSQLQSIESWLQFSPNSRLEECPRELYRDIQIVAKEVKTLFAQKIVALISQNAEQLTKERTSLEAKLSDLETNYGDLFKKFETSKEVKELESNRKEKQNSLKERTSLETEIQDSYKQLSEISKSIEDEFRLINRLICGFRNEFNQSIQSYGDLTFECEIDFTVAQISRLSDTFNKVRSCEYLDDDKLINIERARASVSAFLTGLAEGKIKLRGSAKARDVAQGVLSEIPETHFVARMDGDRIGGFQTSTMTPGKQALFALTLILSDAGEHWPLLIDQPEDDLDSRSIFEEIVPFLKRQKERRQIIMVTHNANLVVGSDAEEVIVANRHGDDRRNENEVVFAYRTGALEDSEILNESMEFELSKMGIREHVIDLLDGGEEAFNKRQQKYKLDAR